MNSIESYIDQLFEKNKLKVLSRYDTRQLIMMLSGAQLNWAGDYLGNPAIPLRIQNLKHEEITMTGTHKEWNDVLKVRCKGRPQAFLDLIEGDPSIIEGFLRPGLDYSVPLFTRYNPSENTYRIFDGMHRFVNQLIEGKREFISVVYDESDKHLPWCEEHVVYDLIRAYQKNAHDEDGKNQLKQALILILRSYGNAEEALKKRIEALDHDDLSRIVLREALQEYRSRYVM